MHVIYQTQKKMGPTTLAALIAHHIPQHYYVMDRKPVTLRVHVSTEVKQVYLGFIFHPASYERTLCNKNVVLKISKSPK
jgi:hypothetical protein